VVGHTVRVPEQPPPSRRVSEDSADGPVRPIRRSGVAVAALVFGVLAIPLALTVYLGLLCGLLGLLLGVIGLVRTRQGRAIGRGMAVAGLIAGLVGLVLAASLGLYGLRTYRDCQAKLGHAPSSDELGDCVRGGL
jgi:Domain of unknown function (DUF4190)